MKKLLISLVFISSIFAQVSALSWNDFTTFDYRHAASGIRSYAQKAISHDYATTDYKELANKSVAFLQDNKAYILGSAVALAGLSILYQVCKPRYTTKTITFNNETCILVIRNGILIKGTLKKDGVTTTLNPVEASKKYTEMSQAFQEFSRKMDSEFKRNQALAIADTNLD